MPELLAVVFAFPTVIFTVLLGVVLAYWLFVVLGAVHVDALGGGDHGGMLDGAGHHVDVGDVGDLHHGGDHGDLDIADQGGMAGIVEQLRLRSAPATVVLSLLITFSWLLSVLAMEGAAAWFPHVSRWIVGALVLVVAPLVALLMTSFAVRPLARLFVPHIAKGRSDLVGKVCVVRTGSVDKTFGEATLEDGGAGLVVRVRVDGGVQERALRRGDQALIVAWDEEREAFTVAPMEEIVPERPGGRET